MKKKIALLAIIAVVMTTSIFATPIEVNISSSVLTSFSSKFDGAKEVSWNRTDQYVRASFKINEQIMFAYFTETGSLIGVSRNLLSSQLPINLQTELRKISANGWITELFEFADDSENSYFVSIETADQKIHLKSVGNNGWSVIKKSKKS